MSESNRRRLFELLKRDGNSVCADCDQEGPEWASITLGVFLCTQCASIHRKIGIHVSRIKSLKLDNWDQSQVIIMEENGNNLSKKLYEKHLPLYYRKPHPNDSHVVREQWIRAKYERKEFVSVCDAFYTKGYMEGYLWKRGKKDGKFLLRKFVLSEAEGVVKYFNEEIQKSPKTSIKIVSLNLNFCPNKIANPNGMQLTWSKDGKTRSIFVYSESGKDIIDWYTAIRAVKYRYLQVAFPETPVEDILKCLRRDFIKEGFLWKTGPRAGDSYKKRWFVLDGRRLMYSKRPLKAYPKGEIFLGESDEGYAVKTGVPLGMKDLENAYSFTLVTPERTWLFAASNNDERLSWMAAINSVINQRASSAPNEADKEKVREEVRNSHRSRDSGPGLGIVNNIKNLKASLPTLPRFKH